MQNPTLLNSDGMPIQNAYERCNEVWKTIAAERNIDWKTIQPRADRDPEYFTAIPLTPITKENKDDSSSLH